MALSTNFVAIEKGLTRMFTEVVSQAPLGGPGNTRDARFWVLDWINLLYLSNLCFLYRLACILCDKKPRIVFYTCGTLNLALYHSRPRIEDSLDSRTGKLRRITLPLPVRGISFKKYTPPVSHL